MNERECKCGRPPGHFRMDITGCGDKPSTPAPASPAVPAEGAETLADRVQALADEMSRWSRSFSFAIRDAYEECAAALRALLTEEPTDG